MNRACFDLKLRECGTLDQIVSESDPVKVILDGGCAVSGSLPWLLSSPVPEQIRPALADKTEAPALGMAALSQCWIFGKMHLGDAAHVFFSDEVFPPYVGHWGKSGRNDATSLDLSGHQPRQVDGCVAVISHFNAAV